MIHTCTAALRHRRHCGCHEALTTGCTDLAMSVRHSAQKDALPNDTIVLGRASFLSRPSTFHSVTGPPYSIRIRHGTG